MRSLLLSAFLLLTLPVFQECHKTDRLCCGPPVNSVFTGSWRLLETVIGFSGRLETVPADSIIFLRMHDNYTYARFDNGRTIDSGRFRFVDTLAIGFNRDTTMIAFGSAPPLFPSFSGDTLILAPNVYDGGALIYIRTSF